MKVQLTFNFKWLAIKRILYTCKGFSQIKWNIPTKRSKERGRDYLYVASQLQGSGAMPRRELGTSNKILRFCCWRLAITFRTAFAFCGMPAMDRHASVPALLCISVFSIGSFKSSEVKCSVIFGATFSLSPVKHVSNAPNVENDPFTYSYII